MSSTAFARIHLLLACVGLYLAGMLSMSHLVGVQLPCGLGSGCDLVTQDPHSKLLGAPFAYYGLLGYGLIALIAVARLLNPGWKETALNSAGYAISGIGLVVSIGLTSYSLRSLHAYCVWCLASAITMSLLFAFHAFAAAKAPRTDRRRARAGEVLLPLLSLGLVCGALVLSAIRFQKDATTVIVDSRELNSLSDDVLAPSGAERLGPRNAPFTLVMFGDLTCPVCESAFQGFQNLMTTRHDFQLVFRHLPLEFHPLARPAAILSEMAAEKGKFWEFAREMYSDQGNSREDLIRMAANLGVQDAKKRLDNDDDAAAKRVDIDLALAKKLGLEVTPSMFVLKTGYYPEPVGYTMVGKMMDNVIAQERKENGRRNSK